MKQYPKILCVMMLMMGVSSSHGVAETVSLDRLDNATERALIRGLNYGDSMCFSHILSKLIKSKKERKSYYMTLDNNATGDSVYIGAKDAGFGYGCNQGRLIVYDEGDEKVLKDFNND